MIFLALLWAFIPGELVMKSGKLLSYKGQYKIEGDQVSFTSPTGASVQVPISTVDMEKTKAREALLDKKKPPTGYRSRSDREFGDFIADNPPRKVEVTASAPELEPEDTLVLGPDGSWVDSEDMGWPSTLTVVNLYTIESSDSSDRSSNNNDSSDYERKRMLYQARYRALQAEKNRIQSRLAKKQEADSRPNVDDVNDDEDEKTSSQSYEYERTALRSVNERIRELEQSAVIEGIDLN